MSNQDIAELFQHIVQSEEKVKQRFEALKQLGCAIQNAQEDLRSTRYETSVVNGKLATINHKLIQEEIQRSWTQSCQEILVEQHISCSGSNVSLREEIDAKKSTLVEERTQFLAECQAFLRQQMETCFSDGNIDICHHEEYCEEESRKLSNELANVKSRIHQWQEKQLSMHALEENLQEVTETIKDIDCCLKYVLSALQHTEEEITQLTATKFDLSRKLSTDVEFQDVLHELETSKRECSRGSSEHQHLTKELCLLQRQVQRKQSDPVQHTESMRANPWYAGKTRVENGSQNNLGETEHSKYFHQGIQYTNSATNRKGKKLFQYRKQKNELSQNGIDVDGSLLLNDEQEMMMDEEMLNDSSLMG